MMVVNVNEWASLRAKPNANSAQLQKIPLGGVVSGCVQVNDKYVECVYNGQTGYVAKQYLQEYVPSYSHSGFDSLGVDMPTLEAFESLGTEVLKYSFNGYTAVARRLYYGEKEELKVVCYDASWTPRWSTGVESDHATELYSTFCRKGYNIMNGSMAVMMQAFLMVFSVALPTDSGRSEDCIMSLSFIWKLYRLRSVI